MKEYEKPHQYIPGDHYVICDSCGRKLRRSEAKKTWDGYLVCEADWEPRHPQETHGEARGAKQSVRDPRPEPDPVSISTITPDDL